MGTATQTSLADTGFGAATDRAVYRLPLGARVPVPGLEGSVEDVDAQRLLVARQGYQAAVVKTPQGWRYKDQPQCFKTLNDLKAHLLSLPVATAEDLMEHRMKDGSDRHCICGFNGYSYADVRRHALEAAA